ncbi:GyrI-like domain-containing protein [Metabacillus fastidiosus]|uniref:GyrI-like domain-containing protein n=1 Tax=Metabacillus fastidiosus TaxID=1458 RepID=UPI003D2D06FC
MKILIDNVMEKGKITLNSFNFVGKSERTTNAAEMMGKGVIPEINKYFFEQQLLEKISNRKNTNIIALYTDYESDEKGSYEYALGVEITDNESVPGEMKKFVIPEQTYVIFTTRKGPLREVVLETWQFIWEWSKNNQRAFVSDFELYDERSIDPENGQADIYISVK